MQAFAASAATAVATAQDVAATGLARSIDAAEHERSRWARELHDETLQELAALKISLAAARRNGNAKGVAEAVDGAIDGLDDSIRSLRGLITDLRPAALDALGAGPAIEALVDRVRARTDAEVTLDMDLAYESGRVVSRHLPAVEAAIYRISQEALTNALKHAEASVVRVTIVENDERVDVTVVDDGVGFDPGAVATGFGLIGMRERLALLGGTLSIDSAPGRGATIHATLPSGARGGPADAEDLERRSG
jgi:signal transduction histidine kinase